MSVALTKLRSLVVGSAPAGYRPGALLAKLRHDLRALESTSVSAACCRFSATEPAIEFLAEERVEAHFLMHVVTSCFSIRLPGGSERTRRLTIRHRGAWKRVGIECHVAKGADAAARRLASELSIDAELTAALQPLDFTQCELIQNTSGWQVSIVHFGASEVVYRFPPLRQYVRLPPGQLPLLLQAFDRIRALLEHDAGPRQGFAS